MINKEELHKQIDLITYDILDNVIPPICKIGPGIWADPFMADIRCYTGHRDKQTTEKEEEKEVLNAISKRYLLPSLTSGNHFIIETKPIETNEYITPLEPYWSFASIATYIILNGNLPQFHSHYKCDFCGKDTSTICGPYENLICLDCAEKFAKGEIE